MTDELEGRCAWHLANWAQWMRQSALKLSYPSRAPIIGKSGSSDFDAMVATEDTRCAVAVDAIIDGLPVAERLAVHHVHLAAVWRPGADLAGSYAAARDRVALGLTKRGIW
jgi:hypothetical protein